MRIQIPTTNTNLDLTNIDHVRSIKRNTFCLQCYVTKMIIKGRIPTMRHVSRTHRVALDWLLDTQDSDQVYRHQTSACRLIDRKGISHMMSGIIFFYLNISHVSSLCCAQNFSLISCTKTMAKRMQEQKEDNRIVAKSKPTAMNLAVTVSTSSSSVNSPMASKNLGCVRRRVCCFCCVALGALFVCGVCVRFAVWTVSCLPKLTVKEKQQREDDKGRVQEREGDEEQWNRRRG